jgi:uncharacterized protein YjiS (DUF1127 family)
MRRETSGGLGRQRRDRRLTDFLSRIQRGFTSLRTAVARMRTEVEIRRKLVDVDDHLLRDMGLVRTNGRIESIDIQRCLGYRQDL